MQNEKCRMKNGEGAMQYSSVRLFTIYCSLFTIYCLLFISGCATPKAEVKKSDTPSSTQVIQEETETKEEKKGSITNIQAEALPEATQLTVEADNLLQYTAFKLQDPLRLILELSNIDPGTIKGPIEVEKGVIGTINLYYFPQNNTSRIEIGLKSHAPHEILKPSPNKLVVSIKNPEEKKAEKTGEIASTGEAVIMVRDVKVQKIADKTRVIVKTEGGEPKFSLIKKVELKRLSIEIENATISPQGQKALDTSQVSAFVKRVSSFQHKDKLVRVVAELTDISSYNISREGANIILDIEPPGAEGEAKKIETKEMAAGETKKAESLPGEKKYEGNKISLDFQDADINNIIRLIAEVSELNIITTEDVKGKVTMRLISIPWDQALDIILKTNKLDMVREGNIIRIAPATAIAEERKSLMEAKRAVVESKIVEEEVEELVTESLSISYAKAGELIKNLEKIKSKRGDITIDDRTNTVIVKDTKKKLADMKLLIEKLDKRTPQVLIEARIVEVNRNFSKELGIQWGGGLNMTTDTNFPNTIGITGSSVGTSAVSLPAAAGTGTGGAISATLGSVTGASQLDIRLSALESSGRARIISTPKITASDNKEAVIESGRSIPYPTTSSAGTQVQFIDATVSLTVTPHITPDNYISMKIVATKNEADFGQQVQGTPSIIKKKATTEVLIKDGDTTVIGGLYKTTKQESVAGVPWFMKIPVIGWLFKKKADTDLGEELLIFITPKIIRT
ncbi:MAG: type IV pilus secretin PilQ [Nitrospinota bacterium]